MRTSRSSHKSQGTGTAYHRRLGTRQRTVLIGEVSVTEVAPSQAPGREITMEALGLEMRVSNRSVGKIVDGGSGRGTLGERTAGGGLHEAFQALSEPFRVRVKFN